MRGFPWQIILALAVAGFFTWLLFTPYLGQLSQGLAAGASKVVVVAAVVVLFVAAWAYLASTARRPRS
jgi:hypothetical protein